MEIVYKPIGIIHSPFKTPEEAPRWGTEDGGAEAWIELEEKYAEALDDVMPEAQYIVVFHFHLSEGYELKVHARGMGPLKGLFATHSPRRPNPVGTSVITVTRREGCRVYFTGVDMVDGTPVLDIKSYMV